MNNKNLLFTFNDMSVKDRAAKQVMKYFSRAGAQVVSQDVDTKVKRTSGISYREMTLGFADSQTVVFRIKDPGDIYQVLINGKLVPIKNQDDHVAAVTEIVAMLNAGRTKFQAKLVKAQSKIPPSIKTAVPNMRKQLEQKRDGLKEAIAVVREEIAKYREELAAA
jgi:predicted ribosome quality control (RQC) complex YloA/Tae2 family protein